MAEQRVRPADLKGGVKSATGAAPRIVLERPPAHRLEVEAELYGPGGSLYLPDAPRAGGGGGGAKAVAFSNEQLWKEIAASHPAFAAKVRDGSFDPEGEGGDGGERDPGLPAIIAALRYAGDHADQRLLVAGHADPGESDAAPLAEARARCALALLAGERTAFVDAAGAFAGADDDAAVLRYVALNLGWGCDPGGDGAPPPEAVREFQRAFNREHGGSLAENGTVDAATRGAYYDLYEDELARRAGGADTLKSLRGKLRFADDAHKVLGCADKFPITDRSGYRSRADRRVELLFFAASARPDLARDEAAATIYERKLFAVDALDRDALAGPPPKDKPASGKAPPMKLADAEPPPRGVGEPDEPLATTMVRAGEEDGADQWAFLEPFDRHFPDAGAQFADDPSVRLV